jgi:hypothetical protein
MLPLDLTLIALEDAVSDIHSVGQLEEYPAGAGRCSENIDPSRRQMHLPSCRL